MYKETFKESWRKLFSNLVLFVPDLLFYIITAIVGTIALVLFLGSHPETSAYFLTDQNSLLLTEEALLGFIQTLDFSLILDAILYFAVFIFVTFFVGSGAAVLKYHMFRDLLIKKKINFKKSLTDGAKGFFWRYIGMRVISYLLIAAAVVVAFLISLLGGGEGVSLIILTLLLIVIVIFFGLWFYFLAPILFLSNSKLASLYFHGFNFLKNKLSVILLTFLIALAVGIIGSVILEFLGLIFSGAEFTSVLIILNLIVVLILSVWGELFKFMIYSKVEKIKR